MKKKDKEKLDEEEKKNEKIDEITMKKQEET